MLNAILKLALYRSNLERNRSFSYFVNGHFSLSTPCVFASETRALISLTMTSNCAIEDSSECEGITKCEDFLDAHRAVCRDSSKPHTQASSRRSSSERFGASLTASKYRYIFETIALRSPVSTSTPLARAITSSITTYFLGPGVLALLEVEIRRWRA
jgi:hypothetical protein